MKIDINDIVTKSYVDDLYGGGVSKEQLLEHFSDEDLIEIVGVKKIEDYLRRKKIEKIRKEI